MIRVTANDIEEIKQTDKSMKIIRLFGVYKFYFNKIHSLDVRGEAYWSVATMISNDYIKIKKWSMANAAKEIQKLLEIKKVRRNMIKRAIRGVALY